MPEPTLLYGIGAAKAGTSWLFQYLHSHPETGLQPFKEVHFWQFPGCLPRHVAMENVRNDISRASGNYLKSIENGDESWSARVAGNASAYWALLRLHHDPSLARYLNILQHGRADAALVADITPAYALADAETFERMQDISRKTLFVFLMRDPIERLWSNVRMSSYAKGLNQEAHERRSIKLLKAWITGNQADIDGRSDYARTLRTLAHAVNPSSRMVLYYEELFTQGTVDKLCDFLGISRHKGDFDKHVWTTQAVKLPPNLRKLTLNKLRPQYIAAHEHMGFVPDSWDQSFKT